MVLLIIMIWTDETKISLNIDNDKCFKVYSNMLLCLSMQQDKFALDFGMCL